MRLSSLLNLGLIAVGAAASVKTLQNRHQWEQSNRRAYLVLDYDDALAVCTRAGMPLPEFLREARRHGATHLSLPELTLNRLVREGRVAPTMPAFPTADPLATGKWTYFASAELDLIDHIAREFAARLPSTRAHVLPHASQTSRAEQAGQTATLALSGHLPTLAEMGLGFETRAAAEARLAGLGLVPRPVAYAWPEDRLIERTMIQIAGLGAQIVAFEGDLILGHEMHLDATVICLQRLGLHFAYFCETRHQKGDWFVAKRLAGCGQVIPAHYFSPAAMVTEDYHSAAHHWGMLARMRGIRLCYVNVFRRIHATDPLDCLHYLEHTRDELQEVGLEVDGAALARIPAPSRIGARHALENKGVLAAPDRRTLALTGLASAGAVSLAAARALGAAEPVALAVASAAAAGAAALPYLDRPRGWLEESYPPSYAPKLLALAGASAAPLAAACSESVLSAALIQLGNAAALAALTSGQEYQQRVEEYRSLNLDLFLPLAGLVAAELDDPTWKTAALAALGLSWYAAQKFSRDSLGALDMDLPAGHTHHLSAAQRLMGDALIALGPRPGRKWAGLGWVGLAAARLFRPLARRDLSLAASLVSVIGNCLMLASFRKPERPLVETIPLAVKSWAWGAALGLTLNLLAKRSSIPE